jgi:hypothetical protein
VAEAEEAEVEAAEAADVVVAGEAMEATTDGHLGERCELTRRHRLADAGGNFEEVA